MPLVALLWMEMRTRGDSAVSPRYEGDRVPLAHAASSRAPRLLLSCARLAGWICCWYTISISLTLYNKWFFHIYDFHYPLLVTSLHIAIKVLAREGTRAALPCSPSAAATRRCLLRGC